jgi:RecB family exonuclease
MIQVVPHGGATIEVQAKGLDCHEIMENFDSTKTYDDLVRMIQEKQSSADYDTEKYDLLKSAPRLWRFWQDQVKSREDLGWKTAKEGWKNFHISKAKSFVGAIDLCLYGPNGEVWIIDYKTGAQAKMSDDYARQLMIYSIAIGQQLGYSLDDIPEKIHLALFYPMANVKPEEESDPTICEKEMLRNLKVLEYTRFDLDGVIEFVDSVVDGTTHTDWENLDPVKDANMGYWCSWCPLLGSVKAQSKVESFKPCELTYKSGSRSSRGLKFITKAEAKKLSSDPHIDKR